MPEVGDIKSKLSEAIGYLKLNDYRKAIELCDSILAKDTHHAGAWYLKGQGHYGLKEFPKAVDCFTKAALFGPHNAWHWQAKGNAWLDSSTNRVNLPQTIDDCNVYKKVRLV
jgi:tetratricopeptide (TPR) repeat protein